MIEEGNHKIVVTETFPSYAPSVSLLFVWIQSYSTIEASLNACMIRITIGMYISCPLQWRRKMFQYGGALDRIGRLARAKF